METFPPMTLRDQFAIQAMRGIFQNDRIMNIIMQNDAGPAEAISRMSYDLSDAFMDERKRRADDRNRRNPVPSECVKNLK